MDTLQGEFIWAEHPQEVPVSPPPLPHPSSVDTSDKMVYVWLTTYPLDIAAHMYRETGYMAYEVAHDQVSFNSEQYVRFMLMEFILQFQQNFDT